MLTLITGIPNAGKTTYSEQFDNVIHLDDVPCRKGHGHIRTVCEMLQGTTEDVCVEGVFLIAHYRKMLVRAVGDMPKRCIWLDTPLDECIRREDRHRNTCIVKNSQAVFQPPTYDEGWDEIIVVKDGKEGLLETSNTHSPLERGTVGDVPPAE